MIRGVTPNEVFNLPLYEDHLVIDVRPRDVYDAERIQSSHCCPFPDLTGMDEGAREGARQATLAAFMLEMVDMGTPEHLGKVLIYGSSGPSDRENVQWLAGRLEAMKARRLPLMVPNSMIEEERGVDGIDERPEHPADTLARRIVERCREVWTIDYEDFKRAFPICCGQISFEDTKPLPSAIEDGLFLGQRSATALERRLAGRLCLDLSILQQLGITHVVVAAGQELPFEDTCGLTCLRCEVPDEIVVDMMPTFSAALPFIDHAIRSGGRVMVQVWGRSRSCSVLMAWLVHYRSMTLEAADAHLKSCCKYGFDPKFAALDQVERFKRPKELEG